MSVGRPQLGYSNLYWTNKITREAKQYASQREEEILEEPQAIPLQTLEEKLFENIDREQIKTLSDIFCPNDLTDTTEEVILYTSPQSNGENHE
jgi:hypothetical protein